jgi:hypothetical protein
MPAALHHLSLPGVIPQRGFWPYVWDTGVGDQRLLYVGRALLRILGMRAARMPRPL